MDCASARAQRMIVEECLKWVSQRKAFGKPLSSQAVVRAKLAAMIARAEAVQAWLENITYQMCNMVRKRFHLPSYSTRMTNFYIPVVQGPSYQPCRPDRFPEDVQHTVRAGYGKGCGADLWGARHHADGNGPLHRTCESSPSLACCVVTDRLCCAQYYRTVPFDSILGGGKLSMLSTPLLSFTDLGYLQRRMYWVISASGKPYAPCRRTHAFSTQILCCNSVVFLGCIT
jgi:hypothetical protein